MSIYDQAIQEHFNIFDTYTLEVVCALNEAEQKSSIAKLCDKLYDKIMSEKFENIDFGDIEKSKGDITNYSGYQSTLESLEIVSGLIKEFKGKQDSVETIYKAIQNIEENKNYFMKGFMLNIEVPMVLYNLMVLSVVSSTSLLIATSVEVIKSPNADNFDLELDKIGLNKSKDFLLFKNLERFNKACSKGDFEKSLSYIISGYAKEKGLVGSAIMIGAVSGVALLAIIWNIIPILRETVFFFYHIRTSISDFLDLQANLIEANSYRVKNSILLDPKKKDEIARRQHDIATTFSRMADKISVKMKSADNKASSDSKKEASKKFTADEVIDQLPAKMMSDDSNENSGSSSLF